MIDIGKLESRLECLNETFEKPFSVIEDAIKVIKIYGTVKHLFIGYADSNLKHIEEKYFPKPKSRRQKINGMLNKLSDIGAAFDINELRCLLIKLRDEEVNV